MSKVELPRNRYVGHRYVPKIFGEWDKRNSYEGLSIVTHEGVSYTSKQHVPVGVDIKNEKYWVVTGNYNAQVEYYRKEVQDLKTDVSKDMETLKGDINKDINTFKTTVNTEIGKIDKRVDDTNKEVAKKANKQDVDNEINRINNDYKNFHLDKASESYLYDLELAERTVNQSLNVDELNQHIYTTQAVRIEDDQVESFVISRLSMGGKLLDRMVIRRGGHGTSIGLEPIGKNVYIWSNMIQTNATGAISTQFLTRYLYVPNTEITIDSAGVLKFHEFPNANRYMTPFTDYKNGLIAFRHTDTTSGSTITRIEVRRIEDVKNNIENVLHVYNFTDNMNQSDLQGMTLDGNDFYITFGLHMREFVLYRIDITNGKIKEENRNTKIGMNDQGVYESDFAEPEGLYLYTDPETKYKTLLMVVVTDDTGRRRQKLFAFSWNAGIQKFLGYKGERTQNVKLTRDDGKAKRSVLTTNLSTLKEPGYYYFSTAEMNNMIDHPDKTLSGGWWLHVSAKDTGETVHQTLTMNSTTNMQKFERIVRNDVIGSWFKLNYVKVD